MSQQQRVPPLASSTSMYASWKKQTLPTPPTLLAQPNWLDLALLEQKLPPWSCYLSYPFQNVHGLQPSATGLLLRLHPLAPYSQLALVPPSHFFSFWTHPVHVQSSQTMFPILPMSGVSLVMCRSSTAPPVPYLARKPSYPSSPPQTENNVLPHSRSSWTITQQCHSNSLYTTPYRGVGVRFLTRQCTQC